MRLGRADSMVAAAQVVEPVVAPEMARRVAIMAVRWVVEPVVVPALVAMVATAPPRPPVARR